MPNNRQWALLIWLAVVLVWAVSRRDMRPSVKAALRAAASPKIVSLVLVLVAWTAGLVYLASRVGLWDSDRTTDTVFWFFTAGLVLFGDLGRVSRERHFLRRKAIATLEISSIVEVLSEVFVLNLFAELLLLPMLAFLAGISAVASQRLEQRQVKRLVDGFIAGFSIGLLLYVVVNLVSNWGSLDKGDLVQQFALPVWLTVGVLPYIYGVGLLAAYELAFNRIDWKSEAGWWARTRAKLVVLAGFHVKARELGSFSGPWQVKLAATSSFRDGRRLIADFRKAQRAAEREAEEKQARLVHYAGVDGVDADGRRLDRREFEETTHALTWIATCQMGWYRNSEPGRYRSDLLEFVLDGFVAKRLPNPPGINLRVSEDGQKWFAWRRTVSGWIFAIGSAGPPPDQWEYDGPQPPAGFPGEDPAWGDANARPRVNLNW